MRFRRVDEQFADHRADLAGADHEDVFHHGCVPHEAVDAEFSVVMAQNASGRSTKWSPYFGNSLSLIQQDAEHAITLDATDRALLALLRDDARASTTELARKLKLSRTTVQSRMERLQRQRVIAGFTITVPDELEAELVRAHVLITLAPKRSGAIETALRKIAEVRVLHSVSGPFDLIAIVAAASIGELDALIDRIGGLDGVERTTSAIVLSTRIQR